MLIIRTELIYEYTIIPTQELRAEEGGGLIIHQGLITHTIRYWHTRVIQVDVSPRVCAIREPTYIQHAHDGGGPILAQFTQHRLRASTDTLGQ